MIRKLGILLLVLSIGVSIVGCAKLASVTTSPTVITSPLTYLSGAVTKSGDTLTINLASVVVSGEAKTGLAADKFRCFYNPSTSDATSSSWTSLDITFPTVTSTAIDLVFILDNTGSMGEEIVAVKNSIVAFASSLEAASADVKFGLVTYGDSALHPTPAGVINSEGSPSYTDATYERPILDLGTAEALRGKLVSVTADGGNDIPENSLDAIVWGYNNMTWRSGAQKVFIVITDAPDHQKGMDTSTDNRCTTTIASVETLLAGRAVVYAVSPSWTSSPPGGYTGASDIRQLADGLGEGRTTALPNTGGKWVVMPSTGNVDLTALGISGTVTGGYTIRFTLTGMSAGTYYFRVEIDTNGDGVFDSYGTLTLTVSASGAAVGALDTKGLVNPINRHN